MTGYRFFIDGVEVEEPIGFDGFEESIIRDEQNRVIRIDYPTQLSFVGNGYDIIEAAYQESYDNELELIIVDARTSVQVIIGKASIKTSNCVWNLTAKPKKTVDVDIDDTIYQAKVFNNTKRPFVVGGNLTLNGLPIQEITPIDLTVFSIAAGANEPNTRSCFDVKECFQYAVSFISDNQITFESDWYDALPDDEKLCICTGVELRDPTRSNNPTPETTFERLFQNLWRKYNLYLIADNNLETPTLRLEQESYLYDNETAIALTNVEGLKRSLDFEQLYSRVKIGSDKFIRELGTNFAMFYLPFLSFVEENYNIGGVINVDRELDLVSSYIIDNNVIADIIENGVEDYDDEIVMIQYTASTSTATKGTYFPSGVTANRFYNEQLLNSTVAPRFSFLGPMLLNSGLLQASFQASNTTDQTAGGLSVSTTVTAYDIDAFPFDDDSTPPNFDTGNNYDTTTYQFTAPVSGFYRFKSTIQIIITNFTVNDSAQMQVVGSFYINGATNIIPQEQESFGVDGAGLPLSQPGFFTNQSFGHLYSVALGQGRSIAVEQTILLNQGDTVSAKYIVRLRRRGQPVNAYGIRLQNGLFTNPTTPISGGIFEQNNPDEFYCGIYEIDEIGITEEEWNDLRESPNKIIMVDTGDNDKRIAYVRNISRNIVTGKASVQLIFNRMQTVK